MFLLFEKKYNITKSCIFCDTGYIVRPSRNGDGSELGYVSHTDPHGKLPVWLVNKVTQIFAPKVKKEKIYLLYKCHKYNIENKASTRRLKRRPDDKCQINFIDFICYIDGEKASQGVNRLHQLEAPEQSESQAVALPRANRCAQNRPWRGIYIPTKYMTLLFKKKINW